MLSSTQKRRAVAALLASVVVSLLLTGCDSSTAHTLAPTATPVPLSHITEYPLPAGIHPDGITRGPDGALWFTDLDKIGRITTSGSITNEYVVPGGTSWASWIVTGSDGALWFTYVLPIARGMDSPPGGAIGQVTTSGQVTEYPLTTATFPDSITSGPDGAVWFTEELPGDPAVGAIGRIGP